MRKVYPLVLLALLFSFVASAQIPVTVTNPTNTTPNLSASYTSLSNAFTALNSVTAMSGPVTLTLSTGSETAPATGLALGSASLNAVLSATNTITIVKGGGQTPVLNAGTGTASAGSAAPDGMLKLLGADYVTIDGLTLTDGNSASATVAMEFGIGLFKLSATDGCTNNTIQNCTINMQRINNGTGTAPMLDGAVGILVINSTSTAATTAITPTAASGTNSNNKFYSNTINGGNIGIGLSGYAASSGVGPTPTASTFLGDLNNDIGGTGALAATTGNTILNFGGGASTNPAAGIRANNEWSLNISNNVLNNNNGSGVNHATTLRGIYAQAGTSANVTISYNTVTVKSAATTSALTAIENVIGSTASSNTVTITNNIVQNCTYTTATTGTFTGILTSASATNVNTNSNQVINNTIGISGSANSCTFQGIYNSASSTNFTANSNTVSNNSLNNSYGSLYCIRASTSTLSYDGNTISNNSIPNNASSTAALVYGFYDGSSPVNETYTNNTITNLSITGSSTATTHTIYGIYNNTATGTKIFTGNNINNLSFTSSGAGYASVIGIRNAYNTISTINNNLVYNLSSTGTTPTVAGIYLGSTSGTTYNVYNNIIGNLTTPASTGLNLFGIYCGSIGTNINLYYNTVYLNGTSTGTGFASAAVYMSSTTPTVTMNNNILVNTSTATGTGLTAVLRRTSTTLTAYGSTSNNNIFYAGAPSASKLIYYDGTNSDQTLAAFKSRVTPRESNSFTENPPFLSTTGSNAGFLHIDPAIATQAESGGAAVGGITTDYDGNTRNATTPDIGADEGNFTLMDLIAPTITHIPVSFTCNTGDRTVTATITDLSGVPTSGSLVPHIYYRKGAGLWYPAAGVLASGTGLNGTWNFTISASDIGGLTVGDQVSYYIIAQDTYSTPNISSSPSGAVAGDVNNVTTPPSSPNTYSINTALSGSYTVGAGGNYTTLTSALSTYNSSCLTGPVVFTLTDANYSAGETFPLAVNSNSYASAVNTLTITPGTAVTATITSNNTAATWDMNGARYVIIDGRTNAGAGGSSSNLSIINTDATNAGVTVRFRNDAQNNTIKYVNVQGQNNTSPANPAIAQAGVIYFGAADATLLQGNDNNTISNCNITGVGTNLPAVAILASTNATPGTDAAYNDGGIITNNNIYDFFSAGGQSTGVKLDVGSNAWTISNNNFYQTGVRTVTAGNTHRAIWVTPGTSSATTANGFVITGNAIGGSTANAGGTAWTVNGAFATAVWGMDISVGLGTATSVQNNTINNFNITTSSTTSPVGFMGISQNQGNVNIGNVTGNTIGSPSSTGGITVTTTAGGGSLYGYRITGGTTPVVNLSNNNFGSVTTIGSATLGLGITAIQVTGGTTASYTINNNLIGSTTVANSINASSPTTGNTQSIIGINVATTSAGTIGITNNTIANINNNYIGTGAGNITGILVASSSTPVISGITGNTIRNLSSASQGTSTGASSSIAGIATSNSNVAGCNVTGNTIHSLSLTSSATNFAGQVEGIFYSGTSSAVSTISKNMIHSFDVTAATTNVTFTGVDFATGTATIVNNMIRLGIRPDGSSLSAEAVLRGISSNSSSATNNIYFNTIYIGGSGVGSTAKNSYAFIRTSSSGTYDIRNNILVNNRSNTATGGKHYAIFLTTASTGVTANYNLYQSSGSGGYFANSGVADVLNYTSGWIAGDANSIATNPLLVNATGSVAAVDLHVQPGTPAEGTGTLIASVTDDYDGQTRAVLSPTDIGADAGDFTITGIDMGVTGLVNPVPGACYTNSEGVTVTIRNYSSTTIDFAVNNVTVNVAATGPGTYSDSKILNTGTLAGGAAMNVTMPTTFNMTVNGAYVFTANTSVTGDVNAGNNAMTAVNRIELVLGGTYTVGAGGNYTTLTAAVNDYNSAACFSGPVTFSLTDASYSTSETFPLIINANAAAGINSLTIKPASGITSAISGSVGSGALIRLNGADYITIDGSNNGSSSRNLTITNTNITAPSGIALNSLGTGAGAINNTIKNCNITVAVSTSTGYGISVGGSTPGSSGADNDNVTLQNNNITDATVGIYANGTAAVSVGGLDNLTISGNTITSNNATIVNYGIRAGNGLSSSISQNTITIQTTASDQPVGISIETGYVSSTVTRNLIAKVVTTATGGYGGRGITIGTGTATSALTIANNVIYGVNGSNYSSFANSSSIGIGIGMVGNSGTLTTTAGGINLYNNSVNMYGAYSYATACITAALYVGTGASALDIRNNIFVNSMNNTNGSGTGSKNYAVYSAAANTVYTLIDYNDYYVSGAQGVLGFLTSDAATIAAWRTATGKDVASISADPLYNSATNLVPFIGSPVVGVGTAIGAVTIDFNGVTRNNPPSIGAYENATDVAAPVITFTALTSACNSSDRTISATVADPGNVATGANAPRIYYRKNNGSWYSQAGSLSAGNTLSGTWSFNIVNADMSGVNFGDIVSYYIIAQDVTGNIGSNAAGATASDVNTVTVHPASPNTYLVSGSLGGTYTVGATGDINSLTTAVILYNAGCPLTGAVTFSLIDASYSTNEVFPLTINANANASAVNTLTIKPAIGVSPVISANAGTIIKLSGADYVTIDGSNTIGGTTKNLTIQNTNSTVNGTTVLWVGSLGTAAGATNNTIKNTNIVGGGIGTSSLINFGIFVGDNAGAANGADNDNLTIQNNSLSNLYYGIQTIGAAAGLNDNTTITGNTIGSATAANSIGAVGLSIGQSTGANISNNTIFNVQSNGTTGSGSYIYGLVLGAGTVSSTVNANNIYSIKYTGTGGYGGFGIDIATGNAASNITISNNLITDISGDGYSSMTAGGFAGIAISRSTASGGFNLYHNTVVLNQGTSIAGYSAANLTPVLYVGSGTTALNIRNNIFYSNVQYSTNTSSKTYAIYSVAANTAFTAIDYNDYYVSGTQGVLGFLTSDRTDLAGIIAGFGGNTASVNIAPVFTSATDAHLVTNANCALNGTGTAIGTVTTDIDGDARDGATPDMGADEFTSNFNLTITNPATACASVDITGAAVTAGSTTGGTLSYWTNAGATISLATPAAVATSGTYYIKLVKGSCSDIKPVTVAVDPVSVGGSIAGGTTVCSGSNSGTLTLSGHTGAIVRWEFSIDGGSNWTNIANTSTTQNFTNLTTTTKYRALIQSGVCSSIYSAQVGVTVDPVSAGGTIAAVPAICTGSQPNDLVLSGNVGAVVKWQSAGDAAFTTPTDIAVTSTTLTGATIGNLSATTYFRAIVQSGVCSAANSATATVQVDPVSVGGTVAGTQTICSGTQPSNLTLSGNTGTVVNWEKSTNPAFTVVSVIASTSTTLTGAVIGNLTQTTYFRAVVQSGACSSTTSASVTVTVDPVSAGGTVSTDQTICSGTQPANLTLSGNTGSIVKWQSATNAAFTSPTDIAVTSATLTSATIGNLTQTTYFRAVVQSGVCSQANSVAAIITVTPLSVGGTVAANQTICSGTAPASLVLSGNTGSVVKWQKSSDAAFTSPTDIASTSTTLTSATIGSLSANTYFRAVVQSGFCATANSASVLVTVDPVSVGGTVAGTQTICSGTQPSNLTLSGNTGNVVKWQSSTNAAFTSPTDIAVTSTTLTGATIGNLSATTYFRAVVQSGVCSQANSASVTVTVDPVSVGGTVSGAQTICSGSSPTSNLVLSGQTGSVVKWQMIGSSPFSVPVDINTTNTFLTPAQIGPLTETTFFRALVQSGVCSGTFSASVTITVSPATVGGTVSSAQTICAGAAPADITLGGQTGNVVKWQSSTNAAFTSPTDIAVTSATLSGTTIGALGVNTYFRAVVQSGACATANSSSVLITVNAAITNSTALAGTVGGGPVCITYDVSAANFMNNCNLIASVSPSGASPVSGNVNACVRIDGSVQTTPPNNVPYVQRHFDILPASNPTTATSTITLYFKQSEFTAFNVARGPWAALPISGADAAGIANLRVTQYNGTGTAPGNYTGTAVQIDPVDANINYNATADRWSVTFNATGSGGFYVSSNHFVLPVTLINFKGEVAGEINKLSWTTATETNNSGFELERSADGRNFSRLTFVATKATNGNSTVALNYSYDDARPLAGNSYYRLKQTDKDGKFSYSNIVMLSRKVTDVVLTSVYPNPATKELNLVITSPRAEKLTVIVTDLTGKVIMQRPVSVVMGENQEQINVQQLAQGTYIIKAVCANGCETAVHRFVKQ